MTDGAGAGLDFRVLGPLEVRRDGALVPVNAPLQRVVLAALLLEADRPVRLDRLIDLLWAGEEPRTARITVQNYVRRLRLALDRDPAGPDGSMIATAAGGYRLVVAPHQVDLLRFHDSLHRARSLRGTGDLDSAVAHYRAALDEWRGDPLPDLAGTGRLQAEIARLEDLRITATEEWAEVQRAAGRPAETIEVLTLLAQRWPLRESARAQLIRALHACGRTSDALTEFRRARQALVEELGVEPGAALVAAQREALAGLPSAGGAVRSPSAGDLPAPEQLPPPMPWFTGREAELARLDAALNAVVGRSPPAVGAVVVSGTAGVGKTSLALHWAQRAGRWFPDGRLYVDLRGFDPTQAPMRAAEAVRGFLSAFGVPQERMPPELDALVGLYRTVLAERRVLLVLDNARDADQVRPLLAGGPGSLALVTSRHQLAALVATGGARLVPLDLLSEEDAVRLLARRLGPERVAAEPAAVAEIARRCARLPLALAVAAARMAADPQLTATEVAGRLGDGSPLQLLSTGDPAVDVRSVLSWSVGALGPDAARMFRLLGLHPGPDLTIAAAASLAGVPPDRAAALLDDLLRATLLARRAPGRFVLHDLLRAYAADLVEETLPRPERESARGRFLDHCLHSTDAATAVLHTARPALQLAPPGPGALVHRPDSRREALAWLDAERVVLLAAVEQAAATPGWGGHAWRLARLLTGYLFDGFHSDDLHQSNRAALAAAERDGDLLGQAHIRHGLAQGYAWQREYGAAMGLLDRALDLFIEVGDLHGQSRSLILMGYLFDRQQDYARAAQYSERALELNRAVGDRGSEATSLNNLGFYFAHLGRPEEAVAACQQALDIHQELGDRNSESSTWDSLGFAYLKLGRFGEAADCLREAIRLAGELGQPILQAESLTNLGDTHLATGDPDAARAEWERALRLLEDLDHPDAEGVRSRLTALERPEAAPRSSGRTSRLPPEHTPA